MHLKLRQINQLIRVGRTAARRRKKRMNTLSVFASLVLFRGNSVVVRYGAVKPGQTKSNRSFQGPAIVFPRRCRIRRLVGLGVEKSNFIQVNPT